MQPIIYWENSKKGWKASIVTGVIWLALILAAWRAYSNFNMGYIESIVVCGVLGGSIGGLAISVKGLVRLAKPPQEIIRADDAGVTIVSAKDTTKQIPWSCIDTVKAGRKGLQKLVLIEPKDRDAYVGALSKCEVRWAKKQQKVYGSPVAIITTLCDTSADEIASELNKRLQQHDVAVSAE